MYTGSGGLTQNILPLHLTQVCIYIYIYIYIQSFQILPEQQLLTENVAALKGDIGHIRHVVLIWACVGDDDDDDDDDDEFYDVYGDEDTFGNQLDLAMDYYGQNTNSTGRNGSWSSLKIG